ASIALPRVRVATWKPSSFAAGLAALAAGAGAVAAIAGAAWLAGAGLLVCAGAGAALGVVATASAGALSCRWQPHSSAAAQHRTSGRARRCMAVSRGRGLAGRDAVAGDYRRG